MKELKKKLGAGAKRKNRNKLKDMVESEDKGAEMGGEGEAEAESKKASPPPGKKVKHDEDEEVDGGGFCFLQPFSISFLVFIGTVSALGCRPILWLFSFIVFHFSVLQIQMLTLSLIALAHDPEAAKVRDWGHKLKKAFLSILPLHSGGRV
jgi:hypothetical protein